MVKIRYNSPILLLLGMSVAMWACGVEPTQAVSSEQIAEGLGGVVMLESEDYAASPGVVAAFEHGERWLAQGRYREALNRYQAAAAVHGKPNYVLENRIASVYHRLGDYPSAIIHWGNAINIGGTSTDYLNRAVTWAYMGECDSAVKDAEEALSLKPESSNTHESARRLIDDCEGATDYE